MDKKDRTALGFIGLGVMGEPMALNLARAGVPLHVWSRTPERCEAVRTAGATVRASAAEVLRAAPVTILMLADEPAVDTVLQRGSVAFAPLVEGRTVVVIGTHSPA